MKRTLLALLSLCAAPQLLADAFVDLQAETASLEFEGGGAQLRWTARNVGGLAIPADASWRDQMLISTSPEITPSTIYGGYVLPGQPLAPGESYDFAVYFAYANVLPPGFYYVIMSIDSLDEVDEGDETNNLAAIGPFNKPDLPSDPEVSFECHTLRFEELGLASFSPVPPDAGDVTGLDVDQFTLASGGPPATIGSVLYFGSGYSDLPGVAFANASSSGVVFTFTPEAGRIVKIGSFDLGSFGGNRSAEVAVWNADYSEALYLSAPFTVSGSTAYSFNLNLFSDEPVNLVLGPEIYNVGVNNLHYCISDVIELPEARVPVPPWARLTLALLIFAVATAAWPRRRTLVGIKRTRRHRQRVSRRSRGL
ncbi:MAG: hypothetical protein HKO62_12705 [Gammaproteobacteria bacterium]|nr:hypothetical protein [Gammaproteobacteria bacterium]